MVVVGLVADAAVITTVRYMVILCFGSSASWKCGSAARKH